MQKKYVLWVAEILHDSPVHAPIVLEPAIVTQRLVLQLTRPRAHLARVPVVVVCIS